MSFQVLTFSRPVFSRLVQTGVSIVYVQVLAPQNKLVFMHNYTEKSYYTVQPNRPCLVSHFQFANRLLSPPRVVMETLGQVRSTVKMESPRVWLSNFADENEVDVLSAEFANLLDSIDPLCEFRQKFAYPLMKDIPTTDKNKVDAEEECVYFCGNSLGLKPRMVDKYLNELLDDWAHMGVLMHFNGRLPAALCDLKVKEKLAHVVGAYSDEIAAMNGLTVNLHLLMLSFYKPTSRRYKIVIEDHAFPSDHYAVVSQLRMHNYTEQNGLIVLKPKPGEEILAIEDILDVLREEGNSIALVMLSGVQYYTGQKMDMERITRTAQQYGCVVGWDMAHAVGNVELKLHDWNIDFACWCSYKYLNSGAGGIGGTFVHRRNNEITPCLEGWWGNKTETRFQMKEEIDPAPGADRYRLSNPPPWLVAPLLASLEIFEEARTERLLAKQLLLTGYLELCLESFQVCLDNPLLKIITPSSPKDRGCQLSVSFSIPLKQVHEELEKRGVICDVRLPSVMRLAPVPLYNSFRDVQKFIVILEQALTAASANSA